MGLQRRQPQPFAHPLLSAGAESTGLQAVHSINGFTYINSNFQHAGDWGSIHAVVRASVGPLIDANYKRRSGAAVGYITGMPALG